MSTLILFLPPARPGPATEYSYTLTADGHTALRHATAPAALLPEPTRPGGEVVAVVPARALSWQRVQLPPGLALGAGQQTPRLRSVLEGLLEDRLLDDASQLHFAIQPDANPGEPVWVAVCDRTSGCATTCRPWKPLVAACRVSCLNSPPAPPKVAAPSCAPWAPPKTPAWC